MNSKTTLMLGVNLKWWLLIFHHGGSWCHGCHFCFSFLGFRAVLAESAVLSRCIIVLTTCRASTLAPHGFWLCTKGIAPTPALGAAFTFPLLSVLVCWGPLWQSQIPLTPPLIISLRSRAAFKKQFFGGKSELFTKVILDSLSYEREWPLSNPIRAW